MEGITLYPLRNIHKEMFAPYLQKGNVDPIFTDSLLDNKQPLTDREKQSKNYIDNFDLAIQMQNILEKRWNLILLYLMLTI